MNRKLIRPTLADIRTNKPQMPQQKPRQNDSPVRSGGDSSHAPQRPPQQAAAVQVRKRTPPPIETNAEIFYYKKQIDNHIPMVIVLQGGEEIEGTIEWYDRSALKVNRKGAPNLLVLKHNIKYMYKVEDRVAAE